MTRPEINLWGEFIFKTKWDADSRRETQIFFFFINVQIRIGVNYVYLLCCKHRLNVVNDKL